MTRSQRGHAGGESAARPAPASTDERMGSLASAQAARQHPHKRLLRGTARAPSLARDGVGELHTSLPRARPERRRCRRVSPCASPSSASAPGLLATNAAARKVSRAGQAGVARVGGRGGRECAQSPTARGLGASSGTPGRASRTRSRLRRACPRPTRRGARRCRCACRIRRRGRRRGASTAARNRKRHAPTWAHSHANGTGAPGATWPSCCPSARPRAAPTGQQTCHTHASRGAVVSSSSRQRRRGEHEGSHGKASRGGRAGGRDGASGCGSNYHARRTLGRRRHRSCQSPTCALELG